jgi:WD40 repeat protein
VTLVKGGTKVVCGSQEGVLSIFDLSDIQDTSDRFPGHPASVDTLVAVTEDMVLTGSSDGVIRVLSILPNKMLGACSSPHVHRAQHAASLLCACMHHPGIVGEHSDWPVERLALSADGTMVASAVRCPCPPYEGHSMHPPPFAEMFPCPGALLQSHDNTVKLWDIGYLREEDGEDGEEEEGKPAARRGTGDDEEKDSDDDDGSAKRKQKKRRRKSAAASQGGAAAKSGGKRKADFFKDLL